MKITAPFLSGEAAEINVGDEAAVILEDTGEQISGTSRLSAAWRKHFPADVS